MGARAAGWSRIEKLGGIVGWATPDPDETRRL